MSERQAAAGLGASSVRATRTSHELTTYDFETGIVTQWNFQVDHIVDPSLAVARSQCTALL